MQSSQQTLAPGNAQAQAAEKVAMSATARRAWNISFDVPEPQAMPSERMQARAEVVRNALNCAVY
ncbi:hypothetical protein ACKI2N_031930 [Cupriavidus sp. 30B13]|uniref:hypothetical protein n=1 Tax=Cupriavidus sp. 30B13 TaxID=3384241 RepID=UPI003B912C1E